MPMYPEELIREICSANDIKDIISEYVSLKRSGQGYMGLCPFHNEKTPSFHVGRDKQLFHCFGCGASGNVITFIMRMENLDFLDAVKFLADKAGIALPEAGSDYSDEHHKKTKRILEMNKIAARFFYKNLTATEYKKTALAYLFERKISPATINKYGLGYAPPSYSSLLEHLKSQGYTEDEIIDASLATKKEARVYDKFRDRVMFPIINARGEIIGFGGRIMNSETKDGYKPPKYLNSGVTPVFDKGKNLFSLNLAKDSHEKSVILCEGYMDVISVYQAGIKNIVAALGTGMTQDQVKLLMRYFDTILLCYDSDEAGQKATLRAIDVANTQNARLKVIRLKGTKDPDEYIKKYGVASFQKAVADAVPATKYRLSVIKLGYDLTDDDNKVKYIQEATEALAQLSSAAEIDVYVNQLSSDTGISRDAIYAELAKAKKINKIREDAPQKPVIATSSDKTARTSAAAATSKVSEAEKRILNIIARSKKLANVVHKYITPASFSTSVYSRLADMIYNTWAQGDTPEVASLVNEFSNDIEMQNEAAAVFFNYEKYSSDDTATYELINSVILGKINDEIKLCRDPKRMRELILRKNELIQNPLTQKGTE